MAAAAAAESLIFGGARGPAKAPKESKALKELKDPTVLEEPKVLEKPKERKELKEPNVLKDPKAYGATSIVVCNYFVLGVKAYRATSIVEFNYFVWGVNAYGGTSIVVCKPTRPTSCGRRSRPAWAKRKNVLSWKRLHGRLAMRREQRADKTCAAWPIGLCINCRPTGLLSHHVTLNKSADKSSNHPDTSRKHAVPSMLSF